jgi:hypothetical protein
VPFNGFSTSLHARLGLHDFVLSFWIWWFASLAFE